MQSLFHSDCCMIGHEVQTTLVLKVCQEVMDPKSSGLSSRFGV